MKNTFRFLVALACASAFASAHAEDLVFTLTNDTSGVMMYFNASPTATDEWEEDILGSEVLGSGESVEVIIADGMDVCEYDMRFEFDDESGLGTVTDTQDLCAMGSYTIQE